MGLVSSTPVCADCRVMLKCELNGQYVKEPSMEGFSDTFWVGDLWKCPGYSCKVVTGFGSKLEKAPAEDPDGVIEFNYSLPRE